MEERAAVESAVLYPLLACNARCPFCSTRVYTQDGVVATSDFLRGDTTRGIQAYTISLEEARARYRALRERGATSVNLQGGEPTIYPYLFELLAYGTELGFKEQIVVTNGRKLADRAFAASLYDSGVTAIALSLFGGSAELHDESMGAEGAFDDMLAGVRNLRAIEKERGQRRQVTGQLILHAKNFRALPEMVAFWYGEGLRYFCIRLLREVPNTVAAEDDWLFDLALLPPYLERALDMTSSHADLELVFPELPYCLVHARYTGLLVRDLAANARLRREKSVESKHSLHVLTRKDRETAPGPCDACQLGGACVRVEAAHARRFSGTLEPIDLPARVDALAGAPISDENDALFGGLLEASTLLRDLGVAGDALRTLRSRRVAFGQARGAADIADRIVSSPNVRHLLSAHWAEVVKEDGVVRYLALSELGATSWGQSAPAILDGLAAAVPADKRQHVEFLRGCSPLLVDELFAAFSSRMRVRGKSVPFVVALYDDRFLAEDALAALFTPSERRQKPEPGIGAR